MGSAQVVPVFQEPGADKDADHQTRKTQNRVPVPAGQAQHGPPRASQKNQGPDHGKCSQV